MSNHTHDCECCGVDLRVDSCENTDTKRLIKFMREEQANATDERESWFKATGDALERVLQQRESDYGN